MIRLLFVLVVAAQAAAFEWSPLWIQSGVARDFAMGNATGALFGSMSTSSGNPAGFVPFSVEKRTGWSGILQGNGLLQLDDYFNAVADRRATISQVADITSLFVRSVSARYRWAAISAIPAEPVMHRDNSARFDDSAGKQTFAEYQTSLVLHLQMHARVQVGGRVDFYSRDFKGDGEGFSYGVILKPRGVQVGLHYQRFPVTGPRWLHPLDRRIDKGTTASIAFQRPAYSMAFQLTNLSETEGLGYLEPRVGAEWRPVRAIAFRAGGSVFTRSRSAVATAGLGLLDGNWFRNRNDRLRMPEDILSLAMAILYDGGRPVRGYTTLTFAWRF